MSHQPERKEKNCLNCGTEVVGHYCQNCGQANTVTHQSFLALTRHFIYDVLHFDGKFFHTLLYLFTRPGYVAKEYAQGKRVSYLDPIRMYLFTSALFFLVFFTVKPYKFDTSEMDAELDAKDRQKLIERYEAKLAKNPTDTILPRRIAILKDTSITRINLDSLGWQSYTFIGSDSNISLEQYDAEQKSLSEAERDGWLESKLIRQGFLASKKYGNSGSKILNVYFDIFLHKLPYLLFISLPFFALLLKLLYVRRRNFFYSDHAVFTLYHYIFSFILLLVIIGMGALGKATGWSIFSWLLFGLMIFWPIYLYKEMRRFYGQGRGKTFGKFLLLNLLAFMVLLLLLIIFLIFSVFQL